MVGIAGAFAAKRASDDRRAFELRLEEKSSVIDSKTEQIILLYNKNMELSRKNVELGQQNIELGQRIAAQSTEITNMVSGGSSFCYMTLSVTGELGQVVFVHQGDHPIFDVDARIVDLDRLSKGMPIGDGFDFGIMVNIGNLPKSTAQLFPGSLALEGSDSRRFNIFFSGRNGFFTQLLRLRKVDGRWVSAIRVLRGQAILLEKVDENFPRLTDGSIDWDEKSQSSQLSR